MLNRFGSLAVGFRFRDQLFKEVRDFLVRGAGGAAPQLDVSQFISDNGCLTQESRVRLWLQIPLFCPARTATKT
ncbi:MAG: hypothetical protein QOG67_3419 [Verrucomicrobiota bacterium]|jgi:hypothetical protein